MYSPLSPLSSRQPPHSPNDSTDFIALLSPGQTQTPHSPPSRRPHCHPFSLLSRHSRLLLILLGTLLIIGSAAFVLSPLSAIITPDASLPGHRQSEPPCTTRECVLTAAGMLANMNTSVDPCEDFFEYSCGGWMSNNPIPDTKPSYTQFVKLTESNWRVVKDALESPYRADPVLTPEDATSNRNNFEKVQGLYASCMNETRIEELDSAPLTALLTILTAHLPLSTTADPNTTSPTKLFAALAALHNHRVASLFAMEVGQDDKNPTINVLILGNDGLSLPSKEYYTNTEFVATLQQSVRNVLVKMGEVIAGGGNGTDADAAGRAERVVAFEKEVAEFTPSSTDLHEPTALYNPHTPVTLQELCPFPPWADYITSRLSSASLPRTALTPSTTLIVQVPTYFTALSSLLARTDPHVLQDYLLWQLVVTFSNQLPVSYRHILDPLARLAGKKAAMEPPRWQTCVAVVNEALGDVLGRWFVEKAFAGESKKAASDIVDLIKQSFATRLQSISWLDASTRQNAMAKIDSLVTKIGYADVVMQPTHMAQQYAAVKIDLTAYLANMVALSAWAVAHNMADLVRDVDRARWDMTPPTVNAYYSPPQNEIVFPAGILQPPFFHSTFPAYMAYGALGMVVGHELTHGFDSTGRKFDPHGKLHDWWSNATAVEFENRAQCFKDQYERWGVPGSDGVVHYIDGTLTMGENLADNGGLARAYEAWQLSLSQPNSAARNFLLPGFDTLTRTQMFFLASAQIWCAHDKPQIALRKILTNPHAPSKYRVWGMTSNSELFSQEFRCGKGARMNPVVKCSVW